MNYRIVKYIMGIVMDFAALFMLLPCLVALYYREGEGFTFLACAGTMALCGLILSGKKPEKTQVYAKEGMLAVALSWVMLSVVGAVPYLATGSIGNITDALFESVSGLTTTGSSVISDIEILPRCVAFWRCFSNWIGGMGVLVFIMAVLPYLGASNLYLMRAESTGPSVGKLLPKMQSNAMVLYGIYIGMTLLEIILLVFCGMPVYDAICDGLATAGTGGFAVRNESIGCYGMAAQLVITIFMFLFGINFKFYFLLLSKRVREAFHLEEVRWYFLIYLVAVGLITCNITTDVLGLADSLRNALFQVATIMTSTGFATVDYNNWPEFSKSLLLVLMCVGACAGSTAGGIKISRVLIYMKSVIKELQYQLHPRSIRKVKLDQKTVDHETLRSTKSYLLIYLLIMIVSVLLVSLDQYDFQTNLSAVISSVNNTGPGLGAVGPMDDYAGFGALSKCVLMFDMLAGRLEIIPMFLLFYPGTWKKL